MPMRKTLLLGEMLVQKGLITQRDLDIGLEEHKKTGEFIGATLVRMSLISEDKLYPVLSEQLKIPYVRLGEMRVDDKIFDRISSKFVCHFRIVPIKFENSVLTIAMEDPLDVRVLNDIRWLLGFDVVGVLASASDIERMIKKHYGLSARTVEEIEETKDAEDVPEGDKEKVEKMSEDAAVVKFVNDTLVNAVKDNVTDIHIEPYETELKLRYRIDGVLHKVAIPLEMRYFKASVISRIKIMANMDISERRLPQDGRVKIRISNQDIDLRVSVLPTLYGESVDIRVLSGSMLYSLEKLGLQSSDLKLVKELVNKPHGIIFITGPTGSGKTTTLYAGISEIDREGKKLITIEDPIEYQLNDVTQIQVYARIGLTFASGLRSMLRHNPDVIMVGEVRDLETVEIAIRSALTGHLVFSTLHTNDAAGGVARLLDMGVEPYLVASSVESFIAQRLVRIICPKCKVEKKVESEILEQFGIKKGEHIAVYEGKGCDECKFTGYKGRTAIYEILLLDDEIRSLILRKASSEEIKKKALTLGMHTLRMDGWEKIKQGVTTVEEVMKGTEMD